MSAGPASGATVSETSPAMLWSGRVLTGLFAVFILGASVAPKLLGMSVADVSGKAIANLEVESLRHVKPVFHGDTIYGESTVLDKKESSSKNDRGIVQVETIGYNQDGVVVCIYRRKVMVPKRPVADSPEEQFKLEQPNRPVPQDR